MAAALVIGPLLRWVGESAATIWVETSAPCTVRVLDSSARTVTIHGRHYGLVVVQGLAPGTRTPYDVVLDETTVWPEEGSAYPPSVIRTPAPGERLRISFGSCRLTMRPEHVNPLMHGICALHALGESGRRDPEGLPDLLFLAGDQVYADEVTDEIREIVRRERPGPRPPEDQLADFEEFARLYGIAWLDPGLRWLLSTVPTTMIFDDHDVADDWNTSQAWQDAQRKLPWWHDRIVGALGSYWIYQHLGNLAPDALAEDELWARVRACDGDAGALLDEFAEAADEDPSRNRWSYVRDVGRVRLLVVDTRCGRMLAEGERMIADPAEWAWIEEQARADVDHLLIGSSLPLLLPRPISDVEGWSERLTEGAWGRRWAKVGERIRQGVDLEHWAAFRRSFLAMTELLSDVAGRPDGPASVGVLSGDVHYSYLARGESPAGATVWQVVCSPLRNPLGALFRYVNVVAFWRPIGGLGRFLARRADVRQPDLRWDVVQGPWFDNALATVTLEGRSAGVAWHKSVDADGEIGLERLCEATLASP